MLHLRWTHSPLGGNALRLGTVGPKDWTSQTQWSHMNYSDMNRGRWDKSNDMTFKVIQGQGHRAFKLPKIAIFKVYLRRHFSSQVEFDYCIRYYGKISKFCRVRFSNFCPVHVPRGPKVSILSFHLRSSLLKAKMTLNDARILYFQDE